MELEPSDEPETNEAAAITPRTTKMYYEFGETDTLLADCDIESPKKTPDGWYEGTPLKKPLRLVIVLHSLTIVSRLGAVWPVGPYTLMRPHILEEIRLLGESHIEDFPVRLKLAKLKGKTDQESFRLVHLLNHVPCMDMERSEYDIDDGKVRNIRRLVLDESRIPPNRHLFKMVSGDESLWMPSIPIGSEELKALFKHLRVRGAEFCVLDKYSS